MGRVTSGESDCWKQFGRPDWLRLAGNPENQAVDVQVE